MRWLGTFAIFFAAIVGFIISVALWAGALCKVGTPDCGGPEWMSLEWAHVLGYACPLLWIGAAAAMLTDMYRS